MGNFRPQNCEKLSPKSSNSLIIVKQSTSEGFDGLNLLKYELDEEIKLEINFLFVSTSKRRFCFQFEGETPDVKLSYISWFTTMLLEVLRQTFLLSFIWLLNTHAFLLLRHLFTLIKRNKFDKQVASWREEMCAGILLLIYSAGFGRWINVCVRNLHLSMAMYASRGCLWNNILFVYLSFIHLVVSAPYQFA